MKVLLLAPPSADPLGLLAYSFLDEEARALQAAGVQLYVLSDCGVDRVIQGIQVRVIPCGRKISERARTPLFLLRNRSAFPPRLSIKQWQLAYHLSRIEQFAARLVIAENIGVIHSHFGWPDGVGGAIAAAESGRPLIASFRGMDLELYSDLVGYGLRTDPFFEFEVRKLLRAADRTVYVSRYMRTIGVALGASPTKAVTVHKGVNLDKFSPVSDRIALRASLGVRDSMILSVGGLEKRKGVHHVLEALSTLASTHEFTYVIVGDGDERGALESQVQQLGLEGRVMFLGRLGREEIRPFFSACDFFVLASLTEASGNVVLEASAAGRPVVCTDSGGPPEYVIHQSTGFVVPVGDVASMAECFKTLLEDPRLADSLGNAARSRMIEEFEFSRMIEHWLSLYRNTVRSDRKR